MAVEQAIALLQAHLDTDENANAESLVPPGTSLRDPLAAIARRISTILAAKVGIAVRDRHEWTMRAESAGEPRVPAVDTERFADLAAVAVNDAQIWTVDGGTWTIAASGTPSPRIALIVDGNWTGTSATLRTVAANVLVVWRADRASACEKLRISTHALGRRLSLATGPQAVSEVIVKRLARAVDARFAALALPDSSARRLFIVATYGYPLELVEHLRIEPGSGIVGSVFESGRMMYRNGRNPAANGFRRRPRYRTDSFIAMPIRAGHETLGVVSVADRLDDRSFATGDVRTLRALVEPAALALARERALAQAESFAHAAAVDPLTGTFNRRYFQTRLEEELERSKRHTLSLTLLLVDIDNFKTINDTLGHLAGDAVIKDIAEILRRSVRMFDVCARFGGEEFAIIMPGSNAESVATVAERIRERIESYHPTEPALAGVRVTVSIGIGASSTEMTPRELINRADQALYLAKRAGKNVVRAVGEEESPKDDA